MSISTSIEFRNTNDARYVEHVLNGSKTQIQKWEDDEGPIADRPGARIENKFYEPIQDGIEGTYDEYGGWVIDLSKIPKDATHIVIYRS